MSDTAQLPPPAPTFRPAGLHHVGVFGAFAGSSRSGKTLSALRVARGIVGPTGKIAAIDTEGRRMSHYAARPGDPEVPGSRYHFDVMDMQSPFDPLRFCDIAAAAEAAGYGCLVTDSFSLEWTGIGGVLDRFDREFERRGKQDKYKNDCWAYAKKPHKHMRDRLLQATMPMLFCIRCNEVPKHLAGGREGTWKVEQDKRFLYEWTFSLTFHPSTPGKVRLDMLAPTGEPAWKMPDYLQHAFPVGEFITEAAGVEIAKWRSSHATHAEARRTVREIARDRLAAAGDEDDVQSVLKLDAVQRALQSAPDEVKKELRDMIEAARRRIANDTPEFDDTTSDDATKQEG